MNHSISSTNRQRNISVTGLRTLALLACCWMIFATAGEAVAQRIPGMEMMAATGNGIFGGHHQREAGPFGFRPTQYEMIPANTGWKRRSAADNLLAQAFANSWVRLDYLNWDIRDPGDKFLGAPLGLYSNLDDPFPGVDARSGFAVPFAVVPSLESISLRNQDGLRGTLGIELMSGSLEANIWYLDPSSTGVEGRSPTNFFGAVTVTSILNNGQPQNALTPNVIVYDTSYSAILETNTMGSEINYIAESEFPNESIHFRPSVGFRYVQFNEKLTQVGVNSLTTAARTSVIESNANNDLFGPQAGIRIEYVNDRLKLGVHPGFVLGFNRHSARVKTVRLFSPLDPTVVSGDRNSEVAPMVSLNAYAEVTVSDRFKLFAGYDLLWMNKVSRPYENIFYNDNGIGTPPGVVVDVQVNDLLIQGLSLGGVLTF